MFGVHVVPPGLPVGTAVLGGIGSPIDPGPVAGCFMAFIASDSEIMFGQQCFRCTAYWRSRSPSYFCAYCGARGEPHMFLTEAHGVYLQQYSALLMEALGSTDDKEHIIDMDAVADAANAIEKPPFYYAEESQQNKFECRECGCKVDILGNFGYCSLCGTRNDLQEIETKTLTAIRGRINSSSQYEDAVRDTVSAFDSFVGQYVKELVRIVPMTQARKNRLQNGRFHNLAQTRTELKHTFDIDLFAGISEEDVAFAILMFHRRHVYEHNGGEVDQHYIDSSGDTSVRIKQALRETQESAHRTINIIAKMARNLHNVFHEIFPPDDKYIKLHKRN